MNNEMRASTESLGDVEPGADEELLRHGRDAVVTRRALIRAARRRFAIDGYRATTVRQIAADAGVNVALINRYFVSKEGLFEACMTRTSDELDSQPPALNLAEVIEGLVAHVADAPNRDDPLQVLLLLRSSGDENANLIRRKTLELFTQKLALRAGWISDDPATAPILLRAQMAIASMLGLVMLRTSAAAEPIASAEFEDLAGPLREVLRLLLAHTDDQGLPT